MYQVVIDGSTVYATRATLEQAEAVRASLRRWASGSTRIEVRAVEPAPAPCGGCAGSGVATRLVWKRGWTWGEGEYRGCGGSGAAPASIPAAA